MAFSFWKKMFGADAETNAPVNVPQGKDAAQNAEAAGEAVAPSAAVAPAAAAVEATAEAKSAEAIAEEAIVDDTAAEDTLTVPEAESGESGVRSERGPRRSRGGRGERGNRGGRRGRGFRNGSANAEGDAYGTDLEDDEEHGSFGDSPIEPLSAEEQELRIRELESFVIYVAKNLVDNAEAVTVSTVDKERISVIQIRCEKKDIGKIIGKNGKTIAAIRLLVNGAGGRMGLRMTVDVLD